MSVHVSLHPAITASTETVKSADAPATGASFRHALSVASEATTTHTAHESVEPSGDKKAQKKTENSKESSAGTSSAAVLGATSAPPAPLPQVTLVLSTSNQQGDEPLPSEGDKAVDTIAPHSLGSDSATVETMPSALPNLPVLDSDVPATAQDATGDAKAVAAASGDDSPEIPVTNASKATSGAIREQSDEASVPPPAIDLSSLIPSTPPPIHLLGSKDKDGATQPATTVANDDRQIAVPADTSVTQSTTPAQAAPASLPDGAELNAMTSTGKPVSTGADTKPSFSKASSVTGKDRTVSDAHARNKSTDSDSEGQSVTGAILPKTSEMPAAFSQQGSSGQAENRDAQMMQAVQGSLAQSNGQVQTAAHPAPTSPTSDAPAQNLSNSASGVIDAAPMSGLSGVRLIQTVHQSEMKLGMNSAEFGNISISTSVTHQALSAQISVDHSELGRMLAAHMPAMEERLGNAYGLQARVEVREGGSSSQTESWQHSGEGRQGRQDTSANRGERSPGLSAIASRSTTLLAADATRLDIRI